MEKPVTDRVGQPERCFRTAVASLHDAILLAPPLLQLMFPMGPHQRFLSRN